MKSEPYRRAKARGIEHAEAALGPLKGAQLEIVE
jgi:hypothetical protein